MPKQTNLIEKRLFEKRNHDDIFIRDVIGGLLKVLNNKLVYEQVWDDEEGCIEYITVPFYYDMGNSTSERFLQDNYLMFGNQCGFKKINGNFDMIPRGMISLESAKIEADSITNRMVMGEYQKEDIMDGKIKTYVAYLYAIPMSLSFTIEIRCSSFTEALKINQACNQFFYKNKTYFITHKGMKLGCRVGFPETFSSEKNTGFTMGSGDMTDKINHKISLDLTVECYQPVFDETTEMLKSNVIKGFANSIDITNSKLELAEKTGSVTFLHRVKESEFYYTAPYYYEETIKVPSQKYTDVTGRSGINTEPSYTNFKETDSDSDEIYSSERVFGAVSNKTKQIAAHSEFNLIYLIDDYKDYTLFPSDAIMRLRWQYRKYNGDINSILIKFVEKTGEYKDSAFLVPDVKGTTIALLKNQLEYDWYIPKDFTDFDGTDLMIFNDEVMVHKEPVIKIIPDPNTKKITEDSFFCLDQGYFICPFENSTWDMKTRKENGSFSYYTHINAELSCKMKDGKIKTFDIVLPIKDNKIETDPENPNKINFKRVMDKPIDIDFTGNITYRIGDIYIFDGNNMNIYCKIPNITIV